jgi:adenylate cyclase
MTQEGFKRKLTAILSADVVGYSRLMGEDEEATVRTLNTFRDVMSTVIQQHRGRVIDSTGDNLLSEFSSVVDSVRCALDIQQEIKARNAELPENRRMKFRIGINLGDVIEEGDRIYGDGVNVAARIESLANGEGITISGTAYDHVKNKLPLTYEYQGEQSVKNIAEPVRVYRVQMGREAGAEVKTKKKPRLKRWQWAAVAVIVIGVGALAIWNFYLRSSLPSFEPASIEKMVYPLPDKPSIAVLPFANLSGVPDQEYLADGITENIITALSYIPEIFVIARNSTFTYKGKAVKAQEVAEDLGVRYILEGSVQRAGDRVRITAQLIDAASGHHLWADRYDSDLQDLFALQDEITLKIVTALQVKLSIGVQIRLTRTIPNFEAWSYSVRGYSHMRRHTKADIAKAREFFERAARLAPEYAPVITALGWSHWEDAHHGWSESREESLRRAVELAKKAQALDDTDPMIHALWGAIYLRQRRYDQAIAEGEKSVALGPNQAVPHMLLAMYLHHTGRPEEAVPLLKKTMRLDPYYPSIYLDLLGGIYLNMEEHEKAVEAFKMLVVREPHGILGHLGLAIAYIRLGRKEQARSEVAEVLRLSPEYSLEVYKKQARGRDMDPAVVESRIEALRKAGLPE